MTVFVSINGVLRDFWTKFAQEYRKLYFEHEPEEEETFEYKINDVPSADIMERFSFQSEDEMKFFTYVENPMEIFGHAAPVYKNVFLDLLKWKSQQKEVIKLVLVSEEYGKAIPSTLFFLSKIASTVSNIRFYQSTENLQDMWFHDCDVWITDDPKVIAAKPNWHPWGNKKTVIKIQTNYNSHLDADVTINKLSDLIKNEETETIQTTIQNGQE
jgi:hypothetical protein